VLQEHGVLTRQALRRYLPALEPRRYLYDLVADYPRRGGKMMRPSLCIATALHELSLLFDALPDSRDKRFLTEIVPRVLERTS
jgi:hypothetical protein